MLLKLDSFIMLRVKNQAYSQVMSLMVVCSYFLGFLLQKQSLDHFHTACLQIKSPTKESYIQRLKSKEDYCISSQHIHKPLISESTLIILYTIQFLIHEYRLLLMRLGWNKLCRHANSSKKKVNQLILQTLQFLQATSM